MKLLSDEEWEILCFIEEFYTKESKFPPLVRIVNATKIDHVKVVDALTNPIVKQALDNRGIEWRVVTEGRLTGRQIACIETLLNIADGRNTTEKLRALGIAPSTYKGWKKNPIFMDAYRQAARDLYGQSIPELHKTVISKAIEGDPSMMKTALAISGEWDDKRTVEAMNVQFVLIKVLEVIQKYVQDPETLNGIAEEFEGILNPRIVKAIQ